MSLEAITTKMAEGAGSKPPLGKTVKFDFGDDGKIYLDGNNGNAVSNEDKPADCTLKVAMSDFVDMAEGRANAMNMFMSGKLKVEGDMSVAMKLQTIIG